MEQETDLDELVEVHIYYRKPGPRSSKDPYGNRKMTVLQPPEALAWWEQATQVRVPNSPNLMVLFDGHPILPPVQSDAGSGADEEPSVSLEVLEQAGTGELEAHRVVLQQEILRLQASLEALERSHRDKRDAYFAEEKRLTEQLDEQHAAVRRARKKHVATLEKLEDEFAERQKKTLARVEEFESRLQDQIAKQEDALVDRMRERSDRVQEVEEYAREQKEGSDGSTAERLLEKGFARLTELQEQPLGQVLIAGLAQKFGVGVAAG